VQTEIKQITEETEAECSAWVATARSLRDDLLWTKTLANEIIVESETPDVSGKAAQDAEDKVGLLEREVVYTQQLLAALEGIYHVNDLLSQVETARSERRILDSLHLLERMSTYHPGCSQTVLTPDQNHGRLWMRCQLERPVERSSFSIYARLSLNRTCMRCSIMSGRVLSASILTAAP
jgi:hypothetical protein